MIRQRNSLLQNTRSEQGDQEIFDVSWRCHLAYLCTGKGAKELSVNVEDFVIDIYYHYRRSIKRKNQLWEFMNFKVGLSTSKKSFLFASMIALQK